MKEIICEGICNLCGAPAPLDCDADLDEAWPLCTECKEMLCDALREPQPLEKVN